MNNSVNQRWYDKDATVSLAMSFIRNLEPEQQTLVARRIAEKTQSLGIESSETRIVLNRRWYDENEELSLAVESFRLASPEDQKAIAIDVIDFLTKI